MRLSLNLKIDGGKMFMIALGPLRLDAQQIRARFTDDELLPRPDSRLRLEIEREGPFDDGAFRQRRNALLADLVFLHDEVMHAGIRRDPVRIDVRHNELHGDVIADTSFEDWSRIDAADWRRLIGVRLQGDAV